MRLLLVALVLMVGCSAAQPPVVVNFPTRAELSCLTHWAAVGHRYAHVDETGRCRPGKLIAQKY